MRKTIAALSAAALLGAPLALAAPAQAEDAVQACTDDDRDGRWSGPYILELEEQATSNWVPWVGGLCSRYDTAVDPEPCEPEVVEVDSPALLQRVEELEGQNAQLQTRVERLKARVERLRERLARR